jgi:PadR family transcriptional regulator PadR
MMNEKISSQMLKGILEGCLLQIISQGEVYGYEMNLKLASYGLDAVSEGSIYPLLLKMQKKELITSTLKKSDEGPMRKYYTLTEKGKIEKEKFFLQWQELSKAVNELWRCAE